MIHEYAIEPEMVASWDNVSDCRFYSDKFGLGQSRLMSEYPKLQNWRKQVLRAAPKDGMELQRVTAMIGLLSEKMIARRNAVTYDGNKNVSWLQNAELEDANNPFHAIIARSNPRNHKNVLSCQTLGLSSNPKWDIMEQNRVSRTAYDMASVLRPILKNCNMAIFIDPFFMLKDVEKWKKPFTALINELPKEKFCESSFRVEFHSSASAHMAPSADEFKRRCDKHLAHCIPHGLFVNFKRWKQRPDAEKLHDRYLLTDIGGVYFSIGLDEGLKGEEQSVLLLKKKTYEGIWEDYMGKAPAFELEEGEFTLPDMKESQRL